MEKIKLSDYGFKVLQIETTAACNMQCSFCPYPLKEDKNSKLELNNIFNILDQVDVNDDKFKYVTFSQFNEPLLDKRIFEVLKHAKNKNIKVLFITNGLLLNKENNVKNLLDIKPDIKISLQVLDQTKHKGARGLNLELDRYVNNVINFCKLAKNKGIKITIDIGCNFNEKKISYLIRNFFGIQTGDPSVPRDSTTALNYFEKYLKLFFDIADDDNKYKIQKVMKTKSISRFYNDQDGIKIYENITLKIKPFFYGRRIDDFYSINNNFSCESEILSVLADGNVVPCCLAYDDRISLGKVQNFSLKQIIENNNKFLTNLRTNKGEKHEVCKKCFGEPTKRGVLFRNIYNYLPLYIRNSSIMNFFKS
jgi:radical SAM protein with 4Fe4S-binding SPASM domain